MYLELSKNEFINEDHITKVEFSGTVATVMEGEMDTKCARAIVSLGTSKVIYKNPKTIAFLYNWVQERTRKKKEYTDVL